jgi:hypothetical protein
MPNVTYASAQAFIPEIWALRAFQVLRNNMVLANLVTTDSDIGSFGVGDILHIPFPGTFSANAKVANTAVTLQTPTDTDVTVTLNKNYEVSFLIEDIARAMQNQSIMDRYIRNAVVPLAEQIEGDLFALYSSLTNSVTVAGMSMIQLLTATKQLNTQKVPQGNRKLVISPGAQFKLQTDSTATMANYLGFSRPEQLTSGQMGSLGGFDIYMSQLVPASTNMRNLAFDPEVFILCMRALPETDNPGVSQTVYQDSVSNLTLRQTVAYIPSQLGVQVTLDVLYGVAVLRNAAGAVVNTTLGDG